MSENSYSSLARVRAKYPVDAATSAVPGIMRWHIAAARGEIQRAAAVTTSTWKRARRAAIGLLYDN